MPQKSCDLDPIPTSVLYDCLDKIIPIVTIIINKSLSSGIVRQCFKHALARPLLKKASLDPNCLKRYRPVSNLPFSVKVLERIVLKVFAAFTVSQPSRAVPICLPKVSQHSKCLAVCSKWSISGFRQWLCVCFVTAWPVGSLLDRHDTIDLNILITKLRSTFGCSGTVLNWFISYLSSRTQSVFVGYESSPSVLQWLMWSAAGFCSGTVSILLFIHTVSTVICKSGLSYNFFADDSQLHKSSVSSDFPVLAYCLKDCIEDATERMGVNKLKMNDDKTEIIAIGIWSNLSQVIPNLAPMSISGCDIPFFQSVRNLGFYLDETMSMDAHTKYLCRILFCQLHRIGKIRSFLSTAANKLAVSLSLSRLDYCNSLLARIPNNKLNKLKRIQSHAARLVLRKFRHASATALLKTLHWLPMMARIQYKIACLCFQCIYQNSMPPYISDLLHPCCPSRTLRSLDTSLLTVPHFSLETFGKRSFCFWTHCLELPTIIPRKNNVLQVLNLRPIFFTFICAEVQVLVSVCITQEGGVCVCVCVCEREREREREIIH